MAPSYAGERDGVTGANNLLKNISRFYTLVGQRTIDGMGEQGDRVKEPACTCSVSLSSYLCVGPSKFSHSLNSRERGYGLTGVYEIKLPTEYSELPEI